MASNMSPIRTLMSLRQVADQRNVAVEAAGKVSEWTYDEWGTASRIWSRQSEALTLAVIGEPPTSLDDALSVLICLAEIRDRHALEDEPSKADVQAINEMSHAAVLNCIVAIAHALGDPPASAADLSWSRKQVAYWLPDLIAAGDQHVPHTLEYERTRLAIDDPTTPEETPEYRALCDRMNELERAVVAAPASSREAVIAKLFMITRCAADGHLVEDDAAMAAVVEAQRVLGFAANEETTHG